jgi:hypothetical protein
MESNSNEGDVASQFKTHFSKTIDFGDHEWEVALLEMNYPKDVLSFVGERMEVYGPKRLEFIDAFSNDNGTVGEYLEYQRIDDYILLNKIHDSVKAVWISSSLLKAKTTFPMKIDGLERNISITIDCQYIGEIIMSPKRWKSVNDLSKFVNEKMKSIAPIQFLVQDNNSLVINITNGYSLHFYQNLHMLLGHQYETLYPGEHMPTTPVILSPTLMYVFSDIVNLTDVANDQRQILHVVPFDGSGKWSTQIATYVPIKNSKLNGVGINIRTGFWKSIFPFASLLSKVYMLLHFRKKE